MPNVLRAMPLSLPYEIDVAFTRLASVILHTTYIVFLKNFVSPCRTVKPLSIGPSLHTDLVCNAKLTRKTARVDGAKCRTVEARIVLMPLFVILVYVFAS